MADIYVFPPKPENTGTIGICGALFPISCTFEEIGNGLSEITMQHPIDEYGKFRYLQIDYLISVEVPVRTTPEITDNGTIVRNVSKYTVDGTKGKRDRTVYKAANKDSAVKVLTGGTEVVVTQVSERYNRYKVKTGKTTGWMNRDGLIFESSIVIDDTASSIETVAPAWEYRRQLFRIYSVEANNIGGITVMARHKSYDLMYNITTYETDTAYTLPDALNGILSGCIAEHDAHAYTNIAGEHVGAAYMDYDPITAIYDPDIGLCAAWDAQIIRDDDDIYLLGNAGMDRGVTIEYGKNLKGITMSTDMSNVCTRLRPIGKDKNGNSLHLTENDGCVDSPHVGQYAFDRIMTLEVDEAKVDGKNVKDNAAARVIMLNAANAEFARGIDTPNVSVIVEFADLGNDPIYEQYRKLNSVYLYDTVHVYHKRLGIDIPSTVIRTVYDCIKQRMIMIELGDLQSLAPSVSGWQITGGITGGKIVDGAISSDKLGDGAISSRHIQAQSINAEAINAGAISTDKLAAGAVTADKIEANSVSAKLLQADAFKTALATIVQANIGTANIDYAQIKDAVVDALFTKDGNADVYYIKKLGVTSANVLNLMVGAMVIKGDDGNYYQLHVGTNADGSLNFFPMRYNGSVSDGAQITDDGSHYVFEDTMNVDDLYSGTAHIADAIITRLSVGYLKANEAFIGALTTSQIFAADGNLKISTIGELGKRIQDLITIDDDRGTLFHGRENQASGVRITRNSTIDIEVDGNAYSRFARDHLQIGNYEMRNSADGGLVFKLKG